MKSKLRNLLLAAMAITLFASCSNIALDDASVQSSESSDKCVLTISYDDLEEYTDNTYGPGPTAVKKYLRKEYGYCLARGAELEYDFNDEENVVTVSNITWGRKLSESELANI